MFLYVVWSAVLISLRMKFGEGYYLEKWWMFYKVLWGLANNIIYNKDLDEKKLNSEDGKLVLPPYPPSKDLSLEKTWVLYFAAQLEPYRKYDLFIDDVIHIGMLSYNFKWLIRSLIFAIKIIVRPLNR